MKMPQRKHLLVRLAPDSFPGPGVIRYTIYIDNEDTGYLDLTPDVAEKVEIYLEKLINDDFWRNR